MFITSRLSTKRKSVLFIFFTVVLDIIGIGIIFPIIPDLLEDLGIYDVSKAAIWGGILSASYAATQFFFSPLIGSISDVIGRRKIILFALLTLSIDYLIMGFSSSLWVLILGRLIAGIAGGTVPTATAYLADISDPEEKAKNFGLIGAAFGLGFILGPVLGGVLGEIDPRAPFFLSALITMLNFIFGFFVLKETLSNENRRKFSDISLNPFKIFLKVLLFKNLKIILLCVFFIDIAHWVYPAVWSFWSKEVFNWSSGMIGFSLACYGIGITIVQGFIIRLKFVNKIGNVNIVSISLVFGSFSLLVLGFTTAGWLVFLLIPFSALSELLTPTLTSYTSNKVSKMEQGELQGVIAGLSAVTSIISPLLMTVIFRYSINVPENFYFPGAPFLFAGLILFICIFPLRRTMK